MKEIEGRGELVKTADDAIDNDGDGIGDDLHVNG
jgi:hypothetical protein